MTVKLYYRTSVKFQKQDDEVKFNNVQEVKGQQTHGGIKSFYFNPYKPIEMFNPYLFYNMGLDVFKSLRLKTILLSLKTVGVTNYISKHFGRKKCLISTLPNMRNNHDICAK